MDEHAQLKTYNWEELPEGTLKRVDTGAPFFVSAEERRGLVAWADSEVSRVWNGTMEPPEEWVEAHKWVKALEQGVKFSKGAASSDARSMESQQ